LLITNDVDKEIRFKFNLRHKFIIAHELGHILNDDNGDIGFQNCVTSSLLRLLAYTVSTLAINTLFSFDIKLIIGTHILACGTSKIIGFLFEKMANNKQERLADKYAMEQSCKIALGGINFIRTSQLDNLAAKKYFVNQYAKKIKNSQNLFTTVINKIKLTYYNFIFRQNGDFLYDLDHPLLSNRFHTIKSYIMATHKKHSWKHFFPA
jgi:Zn-dependent protease with chaperone function